MDFAQYAPEELAVALSDENLKGFEASVSETSVTLRKVEIDAELPEEVMLIVTLTIDGLTHELTIPIPPVPKDPNPSGPPPGRPAVRKEVTPHKAGTRQTA